MYDAKFIFEQLISVSIFNVQMMDTVNSPKLIYLSNTYELLYLITWQRVSQSLSVRYNA